MPRPLHPVRAPAGEPEPARPPMLRQALAEFLGTLFLLAVVIGAGVVADRTGSDPGVALFANAVVISAVLVALIVTLSPVSAAFNPVISLVQRLFGVVTTKQALIHVAAQVTGAVAGVVLANLMFELDAVSIAGTDRSSAGLWLSEVLATFGLVLVVFGTVRGGRPSVVAFAVGAYICGAIWFTSSTAFANPAVTVARIFSDTWAGIAPTSVLPFVLAQVVGGLLAVGAVRVLYPAAPALAEDLTHLDSLTAATTSTATGVRR